MSKTLHQRLRSLHQYRRPLIQSGVLAGAMTLASTPAFAQIAKLTQVMQNIQTALTAISVVAFTIAIMFVGIKMGFQHAKWAEVSNIVLGAVFVGGAAGIAAWLIN